MAHSLETLPPEIFDSILTHLSAEDVAALGCTCRQFYHLTQNEKLWKQFYRSRYTYFTKTLKYTTDQYLVETATQPVEPTDLTTWQECFAKRALADKEIRLKLRHIISNRTDRLFHIGSISSTYGLLALDVLQSYFTSSESVETRNLTREYYSAQTARLISREIGLNLLDQMKQQANLFTYGRSLFNALHIIQCFHPKGLSLPIDRLHRMGREIQDDPSYQTGTTAEKCNILLKKMHDERFLPANGGNDYYDIENSFLFSAFDGKPTIPLTLVAIFCVLAEECGLKARPIGFPGEVMAHVDQCQNQDQPPLIISVFEGKIITLAEINERLSDVIDFPLSHPLSITRIPDLVIRSARNMINSITRYSTSTLNPYGLYAAISVLRILGNGALPFAFDSMMTVFKDHFPMDLRFFELISSPTADAAEELNRIRQEDAEPPVITPKRRTSLLKYRVGQIVRHVQHQYWAVICGWDLTCKAPELWQRRMGVPSLARGANQPFYHILANVSSRGYVAEDEIDLTVFADLQNIDEKDSIIEALCNTEEIGKRFQRFHREDERFIPTDELRDEYPDD